MKNKSLKFTLCLLPLTVLATVLSVLYMLEVSDPAMIKALLEQVGSKAALVALSSLQTVLLLSAAAFVGHLLAGKCGLLRPLTFEKKPVLLAVCFAALIALLLLGDAVWLGRFYPALSAANDVGSTPLGIATALLYGGIMEEILMRLGFMTLLAWIFWKLFSRKASQAPVWTLIAANVLAALLFAAGHLPATEAIFGALTPLLVLRCFLLNGLGGLFFGWLYRKFGLQYAVLSHMSAHIISKLFYLIFL